MSESIDYRLTGFQSPCCEYEEDILSLDKKFVTNPPATFYIRVKDDSKILAVRKGDVLLVNKAITPRNGNLIVAVLSNNMALCYYQLRDGIGYAMPMNRRLGEDEFNEDFVWGVAQSQHRSLAQDDTKRVN